MKKLLFLGACLVALALQPVTAQTGGTDVVTVQIYSGTRSRIVIAYPGGKTEDLPFNTNTDSKGLVESTKQVQQIVTSLSQQGYELKSTFGGHAGYGATLIFVKGK
jgi:hypothetical protein